MGNIASQFATAFRDFVTDGVASSGPHEVIKEEVRAIGPLVEQAIANAALGALVDVAYATRAELNADLAHPANAVGLVYADATDANNDLYIKVGASGSGSWTLTTALHDIIETLTAPAVDAAEAAQAAAEAAQAAAEAAALDAVEAVAEAGNRTYYGSTMFPYENGRTTDPQKNGQFTVAGFRTAASGTGAANDYWRGAYSCVALCSPHRGRVDAQNFLPHVFGTNNSTSINRATGLRYYPRLHSVTAKRQRFEFYVRGEGGPGAWIIESAVIPVTAKGPFALYAFNDGTNGYLHVLDIDGGTWYDGAAVAKPASWLGVSTVALASELVIGSVGAATFPVDNSAVWQNSFQWRGSIGDVLFANDALSKADVEAIVNGSSPASVAIAAGATVHAHIPLTNAGTLTTAVTTTFSGITLTQQGVIYPGPTMRRQGASNWIRLAPFATPEHFPVEYEQTDARVKLAGTVGGLTGRLMARVVLTDGRLWRDWFDTKIAVSGGAFSGHVIIPEFPGDGQVHVAMSSDLTVIASSHSDCQSGPVIDAFGQSELNYATDLGITTNGTPTTLNPTLPEGAKNVVFAMLLDAANDLYALKSSDDQPGWIGDGCAAIVNAIRARSSRSYLIRVHAVGGTSLLALMNDADTTRQWADVESLCNLTNARGPRGEYVSTGVVFAGWEAFFGAGDVMAAAYRPFLTGMASASITQANLNHYLFDGQFSQSARIVLHPCNRVTAGASATATDSGTEADQRDQMRNYAHILGYSVGPEWAAHKMEGEVAAGGLPSSSVTHQEGNDWEGQPETGQLLASGILMLAEPDAAYPGPVFFESIRAGTASNKVIVRAGDPRPYPGLGLAEGATGYSTATQVVTRSAIKLHVKKNGGNAGAGFEARIDGGAWSKANVTSATIVGGREVELTLASIPAVSVQVRYLPGGPGNYASGTITQEAWRSGLLYFTGQEYASGEPNSVDDLQRLGWQVAGSNQALTFTL